MIDIESDGPCPGLYSMISLGAVKIQEGDLNCSFYGQFKPISPQFQEEALAISGHSREECMSFPDPQEEMERLHGWILENCNWRKGRNGEQVPDARFISDNNGFDWQFVNYYSHQYLGSNPFGHSSTNLGSLYKGQVSDMRKSFKHLRETKHTHHPVDDARGNAEALLKMRKLGLHFPL